MRILMVSTDRNIFATESAVRQRMVDYGNMVDELHIIVFAVRHSLPRMEGKTSVQLSGNVYAYPTNSRSRWLYVFDAIRIGKQLLTANQALQTEPWLVTAQDPFETGVAGWRIAKTFALPLQLQIHTDLFNPYFKKLSFLNRIRVWVASFLLPKADCIRAVSARIADSLKAHIKNRLPNIFVFPIWVDTALIQNTKPAETPFAFTVLWVGRLEEEKKPQLALEAFARFARENPDAGLVFAGEGTLRSRLEMHARQFGIEAHVMFIGWQENLASWYRSADVLLVSSAYEGYGRHIIEARAAGLPVVSPDVGIAQEAGAFIVSREAHDMSNALLSIRNGEYSPVPFEHHFTSKKEYLHALLMSWKGCAGN